MRPRRTIISLTMLALVAVPGGASALSPADSGSPAASAVASPGAIPEGESIILQMDVCCGFVPETVRLLSMPTFTLYADGTAIYRPATGGTFDAPAPLAQAQLSPEQIDDLIVYALGLGGLADADVIYDDRFVTDQPTTTFILDTADVTKTVSVYALGFPPLEPGPNDEELAKLTELGATLSDFDAQVAAGNATSEGAYEPTQYLAILAPVPADDTTPATEWPVADVELVAPGELSYVTIILTAEQTAQVTTVPSGGVGGLIYETPDGVRASVTIRPMLPGEVIPAS